MNLDAGKNYIFKRYPKTEQRSLQAWNAADEHILEYLKSLDLDEKSFSIYNDRFGFLTCHLHKFSPKIIVNFASQKKAILQNLEANQLSKDTINFVKPFENSNKKIDFAIIKIPKSMDLFHLQLSQITKYLSEKGTVVCGFMTKYFTPQMLRITDRFFENVEQSKARKKSRVLHLRGLKQVKEKEIINSISFGNHVFKQYSGVFSSNNIDYASQFFVKNWNVNKDVERVLDLASGNGFLAKMIRLYNPDCEIHLLDDDWLAVESSKMNFKADDAKTFFHFNDSLENFSDEMFDLIVCNPPFHFEFETNIEVAIQLFKEARRCLSKNGSLQLVANRHLNYKTHLSKLFESVELLKRNKKFEIYDCRKPFA